MNAKGGKVVDALLFRVSFNEKVRRFTIGELTEEIMRSTMANSVLSLVAVCGLASSSLALRRARPWYFSTKPRCCVGWDRPGVVSMNVTASLRKTVVL